MPPGGISKEKQAGRGIDWMYQGTTAKQDETKAEEEAFLLGREFNPSNAKSGDLAIGAESTGMNRVVGGLEPVRSTNDASYNASQTAGWKEDFQTRHEDPMYMVNQTQREKERDRRRKQELFARTTTVAEGTMNRKQRSDRGRKRSRSKKLERRERSSSISASSSEDERRRRRKKKKRKKRRHRQRSRSRSSDSDDSRYSHGRNRKRDRRERCMSRSRSPSYERKSRRHERDLSSRDRHSQRDRNRNRNRSRSRSTNSERHDRIPQREYDEKKNKDRRSNNHDEEERKGTRNEKNEHSSTEAKVFGLIGSKARRPKEQSGNQSQSHGPDKNKLSKTHQEKEEARNRHSRRATRRDHDTKMSNEERAAALASMQSDADVRIASLSKASASEKVDLHDEEIQRRMREGSKDVSSFVHDMVMKAHSVSNDNHRNT